MFKFLRAILVLSILQLSSLTLRIYKTIKIDHVDRKQSIKLHELLRLMNKELRHPKKLQNAMQRRLSNSPMSPPSYETEMKIGTAIGGTLSVKLPDNPSPIFLNQSPFYVF